MGRDRRSTTADLPVVEDKDPVAVEGAGDLEPTAEPEATAEPEPTAEPEATAETEAEQAIDWAGEDPEEASFRDAADNTLDVPIADPEESIDVTDLDDAENVRFADDSPEVDPPASMLPRADSSDFDSVDISLDDFPTSVPPGAVDPDLAEELDEDFLIEPVDVVPRAEPTPEPPVEPPVVNAPDPQPISLVTPVSSTAESDAPEAFGPMTIAVAGGKGGVGRSLLVANLSLFIAHLNRTVVACDLAPDGANLHTFLGMEPLLPNTGSMLRGGGGPHVELFPGLNLRLCRSPMPIAMGDADPLRRQALEHAQGLGANVLLLDLGTHADPLTLDSFNEADASIVVVTPEPIAMERAYAFLRAALYRRLLHGEGDAPVVARALLTADHVGQLDTPDELVAAMRGVNPVAAEALAERVAGFSPMILLNHCRSRSDRQLGKGIASALRHRWGITAEPIGALEHDDAAVEASRRRRPLMMEYPGSTLGAAIDRLARRLVSAQSRREAWA